VTPAGALACEVGVRATAIAAVTPAASTAAVLRPADIGYPFVDHREIYAAVTVTSSTWHPRANDELLPMGQPFFRSCSPIA